jgi:hypothetical protein
MGLLSTYRWRLRGVMDRERVRRLLVPSSPRSLVSIIPGESHRPSLYKTILTDVAADPMHLKP